MLCSHLQLLPSTPTSADFQLHCAQTTGTRRGPCAPHGTGDRLDISTTRAASVTHKNLQKSDNLLSPLRWPLAGACARSRWSPAESRNSLLKLTRHVHGGARRMQMKYEINKYAKDGLDLIGLLPWHPRPHHTSPEAACPRPSEGTGRASSSRPPIQRESVGFESSSN